MHHIVQRPSHSLNLSSILVAGHATADPRQQPHLLGPQLLDELALLDNRF